ncbi:MAG: hypothetical protein ACRD9R_23930, partial [Pyrinomonadaceae bacterium]
MEALVSFFLNNTPSWKAVLIGGPAGVLWSYYCLRFAAYLKCAKGIKTGYTRKTFHVMIFFSVVLIQVVWGLPGVFLFGGAVTLVLSYAVAYGAGHPLYEAIARENDAPHRTYYVIIPYFATLIGGVVSNLLFGPMSLIGYLVGGLGDAAGEPVGTKWGRHRYLVPSLGKVRTTRSYEGSLGVFVVSLAAVAIGVWISPQLHFSTQSVIILPALAMASAFVEAVSPHGWDNTTMQIVPGLM